MGTIRMDNEWRIAVKTERGVLDVVGAAEALGIEVPNTIDQMFREGGGRAIEAVVQKASSWERAQRHIRAASDPFSALV